jgi:hypothetical protein
MWLLDMKWVRVTSVPVIFSMWAAGGLSVWPSKWSP